MNGNKGAPINSRDIKRKYLLSNVTHAHDNGDDVPTVTKRLIYCDKRRHYHAHANYCD